MPAGVNTIMFNRIIPLSNTDISSGRFEQLALFVATNWPFKNRPSKEDAIEIVSKSLGYRSFAEAKSKVSIKAQPCLMIHHNVTQNFSALGYAPKKQKPTDIGSLDDLAEMFGHDKASSDFVDTWPLELISRWNIDNTGCQFSQKMLSGFESKIDPIWRNNIKSTNGFVTVTENSKSAASLVATLCKGLSFDALQNKTISDIIDDEMAEALFQDVMPTFLREIFTLSEESARRLVKDTGLSITDLRELPRNDLGFPNLYRHMRQYVSKNLLPMRVMSLYTTERGDDGFYTPHGEVNPGQAIIERNVEEGKFIFCIERDELETNIFRTYTWFSQLQNDNGIVLAQAMGTYVSGPARENVPGFELISALDEMCDIDVEIADVVLSELQQEILEEDDELVDKGSINTRLIFHSGNLITLVGWERSENSLPGTGVALLGYCIDAMKRKYRRNIHIAAIIDPTQYLPDASLVPAIEDRRLKDIDKINRTLNRLRAHENVLNIYTRGRIEEDGLSVFTRYCGEAYSDHL